MHLRRNILDDVMSQSELTTYIFNQFQRKRFLNNFRARESSEVGYPRDDYARNPVNSGLRREEDYQLVNTGLRREEDYQLVRRDEDYHAQELGRLVTKKFEIVIW